MVTPQSSSLCHILTQGTPLSVLCSLSYPPSSISLSLSLSPSSLRSLACTPPSQGSEMDSALEPLLDYSSSYTNHSSVPVAAKHHRNHIYQLDSWRWFILFLFSLINANQCLTWFSFSSMDEDDMLSFFGPRMDKTTTHLLMNYGPLFGAIGFPLHRYLSSKSGGLKRCVVTGIVLSFAGNVIRLLPILVASATGDASYRQSFFALACYHFGQILNALTGPLVMSSASQLSQVWFAEDERTTATAIAETSNGVGTAIGFLNPIFFATSVSDIPVIFYMSTVISTVPLLCAVYYFPSKPLHPPSAASSASELMASDPSSSPPLHKLGLSFLVVVSGAAILSGVGDGWQGCFQSILGPESAVGISDTNVGWIGFANCISGNLAAVASGFLMDHLFGKRFKAGLLWCLALCLLSTMWFTAMVNDWVARSEMMLIFAISLNGIFRDACNPLFYELSAELVWPAKVELSGGLLVFMLNLSAGIMILLDAYLEGSVMNYIICGVLLVTLVAIAFLVKEEYKRPRDSSPLLSQDDLQLTAE